MVKNNCGHHFGLTRARQDKMIEVLMMNCTKRCFFRKILAKVIMPNTFLGRGKGKKNERSIVGNGQLL